MKNVTVGIKSFYRSEQLTNCLESLKNKGVFEVIVADDGEIDAGKRAVYSKYGQEVPLRLLELDFDTGISFGRNQIVKACKTEFLLMLDDDQVVPDNVEDLRIILRSDPQLGGVSGYWNEWGELKCRAFNIFEVGRNIIKDIGFKVIPYKVGSLTYFVFDQIPNSTLYRIETLKDISWDNNFKIGREHLDFFLAHKRFGRWKFAVTPDVLIGHYPGHTPFYRNRYRANKERLQASDTYFKEKWNIKAIITGLELHCRRTLRRQLIHYMLKFRFPPKAISTFNTVITRIRNRRLQGDTNEST